MARCGRCGLWQKYNKSIHEKTQYAGVCLWWQVRLAADEEYESRNCKEFFERIPDATALEQFKYKCQRDNLGDAYRAARSAKLFAFVGIALSLLGLFAKYV